MFGKLINLSTLQIYCASQKLNVIIDIEIYIQKSHLDKMLMPTHLLFAKYYVLLNKQYLYS